MIEILKIIKWNGFYEAVIKKKYPILTGLITDALDFIKETFNSSWSPTVYLGNREQ